MNFKDALDLLKTGSFMRRPDWLVMQDYVELVGNQIIMHYTKDAVPGTHVFGFSDNDMLATNWEEVII